VLFWLGFVACALSFSRSMVLQVVPALFVMWVLTRRQLGRLLFIVLGGLALLYVLSYMPLDSAVAQQWGLQRWAIAGRLAEDHTEPREVIWRASMRAFASNPIIGVGVGNFMARYFEFREIWETSGYLVVQQRGNHSMYLAALTETGLVGTSAMLVMLGYFLWLGRRVVRQARSDGDLSRYLVGAAILAAYVGEVCGGIALQLLTHNYVWAIIALLPLLDAPRRRAPRAEALPAA
jgi:O-antigen ligase